MAVAAGLVLAAGVVALGPRPTFEEVWVEPDLPPELDVYLDSAESAVPGLRPEARRGIVWADPSKTVTPVSLVYLHGFSADRHEIEPVMSELGRVLGANVYFTRLRGHGRDGEAMAEAGVEDWLADAAEAVAVGKRIGEAVVLVGTSTGGTLATWVATRPEAEDWVDGLILVSPNFQPRDRSSRILLQPWGGQIARLVVGPERCFEPENDAQELHWTTCYPTSALLPMMALVERVRTTDLRAVDIPVLLVYSPRDRVVDAGETERVLAGLDPSLLRTVVLDATGDPSHHVLAGDVLSPSTNEEMIQLMHDFVEAEVRQASSPSSASPPGPEPSQESLPERAPSPSPPSPGHVPSEASAPMPAPSG